MLCGNGKVADIDLPPHPLELVEFVSHEAAQDLLASKRDERDHMLFCEQVPEIGIAWRLGRVGVRLGESVAEQGVELAHKRHVGGAEAAKFERAKGHALV